MEQKGVEVTLKAARTNPIVEKVAQPVNNASNKLK